MIMQIDISYFWSCRRWVLGKSGLGGGRGAISTASFSILINGTPIDFFQSSRSLRQEDPLPPYLFVVAMEVLNCLSKKAISGGFLSRC